MNTTALWTTVKDELRARREAREALKALRADLGNYRTPAEIEDLLASVDSEDSPEGEFIRGILMHNLHAHHSRQVASRWGGYIACPCRRLAPTGQRPAGRGVSGHDPLTDGTGLSRHLPPDHPVIPAR